MKSLPRSALAILAAHFLLFAFVAIFRPMAFLLDDAFYSLTVSANIAAGQGISYGGFPTNGFQPLYSFIMAPVLAIFGADRMLCLKIALLFCAICSTAALALLFRITRRYADENTALLALALGAFSTNLMAHGASGLETTLHGFLFLLIVDFYTRKRCELSGRSALLLGLLLALLAYARLDACFVFVAVGLDRFFVNGKTLGKALWQNLAIFIPACLILVPWFAWNLSTFDTISQSSGAFHHWRGSTAQGIDPGSIGFLSVAAIKLASLAVKLPLEPLTGYRALVLGPAELLLGTRKLASNPLIQLWQTRPVLAVLLVVAFLAAAGLLLLYGRSGIKRLSTARPLLWIAPALLGAAVFYPLYLINYSMRHFYAYSLLLAFPVAAFISGLLRIDAGDRLLKNKKAALLIAFVMVAIFRCGPFDPALHGGNEFGFEKITQIEKAVPKGSSIGYTDCGFYGYFLTDYNVVNLDGILNFEAQKALKENRLSQYIRMHNVQYILALDNFHNEYRREFQTDLLPVLEPLPGSDFIYRLRED